MNPARAQELNLSPESISQQAYYALHGGLTNEFYRLPNIRQNTILVRFKEEDRRDAQDLESLHLTTPDGRQVPLKSVASVTKEFAPTAIEHDGLRRVVGVTGYYRNGQLPSMDLAMGLVAKAYGGDPNLGIQPVNFPPGYGMELRGDMTQMMDSFRRLLEWSGVGHHLHVPGSGDAVPRVPAATADDCIAAARAGRSFHGALARAPGVLDGLDTRHHRPDRDGHHDGRADDRPDHEIP